MSEIVYIDVHKLWPHPDNPRKDLGDLTELAASIKTNGIYQNLTVVPLIGEISKKWDGKSYRVIIGHRRLAAAKMAGLETVPCVIAEMTEKQQIQTMLLENMQRKDLKLYEEAQSFQTLLDFGDSVEEISQASGFSPTTIRRRVKLNELDKQKLKEVVDSRQIPLGDFDELAKIEDVEKRNELLQYVGTQDFRWKFNGALERQEMNKKLPDVKAWLKENKIKQLPQGKEYSTEYERMGGYDDYKITEWEQSQQKIKLANGKKYFYQIDTFRCVVKLFLHKPEERVTRSKEEIEREKRIKRAWEYIELKSLEMYRKRKAFIEGVRVTKKNESAVFNGMVLRNLVASFRYIYWDNKEMFKLFGMEYNYGADDNFEKLFEKYKTDGRDKLAKIIYFMWADEEKRLPIGTEFRRAWPEWNRNIYLTAMYEWLVGMGYEMSEQEKDLMSGKDKIYVADTEVPDSELVPQGEPVEDPEERPGEV